MNLLTSKQHKVKRIQDIEPGDVIYLPGYGAVTVTLVEQSSPSYYSISGKGTLKDPHNLPVTDTAKLLVKD